MNAVLLTGVGPALAKAVRTHLRDAGVDHVIDAHDLGNVLPDAGRAVVVAGPKTSLQALRETHTRQWLREHDTLILATDAVARHIQRDFPGQIRHLPSPLTASSLSTALGLAEGAWHLSPRSALRRAARQAMTGTLVFGEVQCHLRDGHLISASCGTLSPRAALQRALLEKGPCFLRPPKSAPISVAFNARISEQLGSTIAPLLRDEDPRGIA